MSGISHPSLPGTVRAGAHHRRSLSNRGAQLRLFLEGRHKDHQPRELRQRVEDASAATRYEEASALHELLHTVEEMGEKQKMAAAEGSDTDILAYYAEPPLVAVNLFHLRHGHIVDRRDFFWEDQLGFDPQEFVSSLIKQVYLNEPYIPAFVHVPIDFEDREPLEEILSEKRGRKVEINTPQRGPKKALLDLVESNAQHSFEQRFRVLKPSSKAIQARRFRMRFRWKPRRAASSASISRTFKAPTKSPVWWCGKTAR